MMMNICSVTYHLDGLTTSASNYVFKGSAFNASFVGDTGKQLLPNTVKVTMDGVDVTNTAFDLEDNTVKIANVTGAIEIEAKGAAIASGYEPLQYIHCVVRASQPGINLGFPPTEKTKIYTEFKVTGGTKGYLLSHPTFSQGNSYCALHVNGTPQTVFRWNNLSTSGFSPVIPNNKDVSVTIDKGTLKMSWEGQTEVVKTLANDTPFTGNKNLTIFGNTTSVDTGGTLGHVYCYKHWEDDVLTHDFIPARRVSDGLVGLLDIVNNTFKHRSGSSLWVAPYIPFPAALENCTGTMLSSKEASGGIALNTNVINSVAVIGSIWQCKLTPDDGYTFNNADFQVILNGTNVTNTVATYNNITDEWTITLTAHWNDDISIVATAAVASTYSVVLTGNDVNSNISQIGNGQSATIVLTGTNGKQVLPDSVSVVMKNTDLTSTSYDLENETIQITNATGNVIISSICESVDAAYKPISYISTRVGQVSGNMISTPYYPNSNTKLVMDVDLIQTTYALLFAVKNPNTAPSASAPQFYFWPRITTTNTYSFAWGSANQSATSTAAGRMLLGKRTTVTCDKGTFRYTNTSNATRTQTLNGGTWDLAGTSYNLKLFSYINSASSNGGYASNGKIYRTTISENDVTLYDYIPVIRVSDGFPALYDLVSGDVRVTNGTNYITPYVNVTRTMTGCTSAMLSANNTGYDTKAVYGKTWSCKFTPSTNYTFNDSTAVFTVLINSVDETTNVATYDSATDTWTVTLTAHWGDTIAITATAIETTT